MQLKNNKMVSIQLVFTNFSWAGGGSADGTGKLSYVIIGQIIISRQVDSATSENIIGSGQCLRKRERGNSVET